MALIASLLAAVPAQALNDTGTGGVFVPSTGRILDTAKGIGGYSTPMEAGTYRSIKVAGLAGLPDDGSVGAVSLNATVGASTGYGTLIGRPDANSGRSTMLIYNGVSGEYTSNTATVAVGADGTIQVMTETSARLILDVQGYYTANTDGIAAGGFVPVARRIVDTRSGTGAAQAAIAPGKSIDVQIAGTNGVPTGASGAVVNLIAVNSTAADGYLTPFAAGATKPANSLHYAPSETTSIQAQVPLSADGKVTIANASTTTNLLVDLQGYFTAAGKGGAAFTPAYGRAYDSRATGNTALAENETRSIQIAGTAGVPAMGSGISAVVLTLVVAHGGSNGYADAWAEGTTKPNTTAINFQINEIQTNTITVPLGANGKISLRNAAKATNYVVDVQGWYSNPLLPTVTCPTPYAAGAWVTALPEDEINCTVKVAPADSSNSNVDLYADGVYTAVTRSDTSSSTKTVTLQPEGGSHTITVVATGSDGADLRTAYEFGLGDWTKSNINPAPENAATTSLTPELSITSATDQIPSDALIDYTIRSADGTVVAESGDTTGEWAVPADVLAAKTQYSWNAVVTAPSGGASTDSVITTPTWTLTADPNVAPDDSANAAAAGSKSSYNLGACRHGGLRDRRWYNYTGVTGAYKTAVNTAVSQWNGLGLGISITQTSSASGAQFQVSAQNYGNVKWSGMAPFFDDCPSGYYNRILPLNLNTYYLKNYTAQQKATTTAHEFGHNLGLRHVGDDKDDYPCAKVALMNPGDTTRFRCGVYSPKIGDVNGIKKKYKK
ncbi:M43 family zinc metalloprotease [Curtobacterium sp. ISL-83]|uniref:M43 family zinc metalloprotease n=1 Tax=Curtobacterium sp. ISL-83 TaxID=2819145 RepID=UPI001BE7B941|nr:M43 family zinc metalloprotease [Curtobacterium sp. ISL-83]MBT2501227.1 hypothetical protein [Curtobacterium sp. ISL-83]